MAFPFDSFFQTTRAVLIMDESVPMDIIEPDQYVPEDHPPEPIPAPAEDDMAVVGGRTYYNICSLMDQTLPKSGSASEEESDSEMSESEPEESDTDSQSSSSSSDGSQSSSSPSGASSPNPVPLSYFLSREDWEEQQMQGKNRQVQFNLHEGRVRVLETELFSPAQPTVTPATRIVAPVTLSRAKVSKPRPERKPAPALKAHAYVMDLVNMFQKLTECPCQCFLKNELEDEKVQQQIFTAYGNYHRMSVKERDQAVKLMIKAYVLPNSPKKKSPRQERIVAWEGRSICVNCWCKVNGVGMSTYFFKKKQVSVVWICELFQMWLCIRLFHDHIYTIILYLMLCLLVRIALFE